MKKITPDSNLQNEIQKSKILESRDFYKGKSFRFVHEWHTGTNYFNDQFNVDFVTFNNTLLVCKKSHQSSDANIPTIIYDPQNPLQPIGVNSDFWEFVLSGIASNVNLDFNSFYTKEQIDNKFVSNENLNSKGYITSTEADQKINNAVNNIDLSSYYTKDEINSNYQPKGDYLTEIPDEYVTDEDLGKREKSIIEYVGKLIAEQNNNISSKQDALISGQNIKTINGQSILGEGNIEIIGSSDVDLTGYATEQWVENKGYLTSIPDTYVTEDELNNSIQNITTNINLDGGETNFIDNGTNTI